LGKTKNTEFIFGLAIILTFSFSTLDSKTVISGEQLRFFPIQSFQELVLYCPYLTATTIDGNHFYIGDDFFENNSSKVNVFLDGIQVNINSLNFQDISLTPDLLSNIYNVIIYSSPVFLNGVFCSGGAIQIETKKESSLYSELAVGNETGDPGPYKYTAHKSPNIDRIIEKFVAVGSYLNNDFYLSSGMDFNTYSLTDLRMRKRIHTLTDKGSGGSDNFKFHICAEKKALWSKHSIFANFNETKDHFLFFEPFGREVPANSCQQQFLYKVQSSITSEINSGLSVNIYEDELTKVKNFLERDFDWKRKTLTLNSFLHWNKIYLQARQSWESLDSEHFSKVQFDKHSDYNITYSDEISATGLSVTLGTEESYADFFPYLYLDFNQLNSLGTFAFNLSWQKVFTCQTDNIWYLTQVRHFSILAEEEINSSVFFKENQYKTCVTGDYENKIGKMSAELHMSYEVNHNVEIPIYEYGFDENQNALTPDHDITISTGDYQKLKITPSISYDFNSPVKFMFSTSFMNFFTNKELRNHYKKIPSNKTVVSINWQIFHDLMISAWFRYQSSSVWEEYAIIDDIETTCYSNPAYYTVKYSYKCHALTSTDLLLKKNLWKGRLFTELNIRNIFNENISYHPLGAEFFLSVYFKIGMQL